jgi:hypothetical protein
MNARSKVVSVVAVAGLLGATAMSTASAGSPSGCTASSRGRPLATVPLVELSRAQVLAELGAAGLDTTARTGVRTYRLEYCTVSPSGTPTNASGLVALPQGPRRHLPLVVYAHSTVAAKTGAPSFLTQTEGRLVPFFFSSDGFAVVAPDYLGLGTSPGKHPYIHAATEASATMDMLTAADRVSAALGVALSRTVLVSGHSQGGHATMAIGQAVQRGHGPWRLGALAPMAGPYDLSATEMPALLDPSRTNQQRAGVYLAYVFTSWKRLYHLYTEPGQVFTARYAGSVEGLFDGTHEVDEIDAALPAAAELFRPEILALVAHPTGRFAAALRDNDVCHWAPAAPTRLYLGSLDTDVVPANAYQCRRQIIAHGGTATAVDLGAVDHVGTAIAALPQIRTWFEQLAYRGS